MTRIDPYDVISVEPDRFIQSQAARHVRPSWLAKQLGITTDELGKRLNLSVADLDARLDRSAKMIRKAHTTSARLLWELEPFGELRARPLGGAAGKNKREQGMAGVARTAATPRPRARSPGEAAGGLSQASAGELG